MKGIVFTEFLEMVEDKFGLETLDYIITNSELESEGSYTAVGTYDFFEMQQLLTHLSEVSKIPVNDLIYTYGLFFFKTLTTHHSDIFNYYTSPLDLVASIENHIHVQVRKIYPDAELPSFTVKKENDHELSLLYSSERAMFMFAKALMEKTFEYYKENVEIKYELMNEQGTQVKFLIKSYGPN
ncbi:heme NO-binding domain-containing protein [Mesonia aestuariivivens]|uniref:Heme NO-binding domain-containing protein n=1 Tax=Mesonia aestuariivivens TaxID=2796128 RepID=A0ABS6W4M7_9FLAO|nr:heme NO-binding domain-containing protein [Mesonia aestuariivivens]MBW2962817.1 heme NO-binding domain-containing protein [Mesonia aestuariivivens]